MVHPLPLDLEGESVLWGEGMHVPRVGALCRDMRLRDEVGERRQEVWGIPEVERGQR